MRPDSLLRLWRYITYLLTNLLFSRSADKFNEMESLKDKD